jgi:hypothetical protein
MFIAGHGQGNGHTVDLDICRGMYMDMDTDMNMNMDMDVDMDMDMGFSSNNPVTFGRFLKAYYRERKHSSNRPPVTINLKGATHLTRKHFFFTITYAVKFKRAGL